MTTAPVTTAPVTTAPVTAAFLAGAETAVLRTVQRSVATGPAVHAARGLSHFGEHALGWLGLGAVAAAVDSSRRWEWLGGAVGVAAAHGAAIAVKRIVRRQRPRDTGVRVFTATPSALSFPSAHATSTTAAAVLYGGMIGRNLVPVLVPPMAVSRLVLGVHYPTDVLAGSLLGAAVAAVTRRLVGRSRRMR